MLCVLNECVCDERLKIILDIVFVDVFVMCVVVCGYRLGLFKFNVILLVVVFVCERVMFLLCVIDFVMMCVMLIDDVL